MEDEILDELMKPSLAKLYLTSLGGPLFWLFIGPALVTMSMIPVLENWFLGYWSSQYDLHPETKPPVKL